MNSFSILTFNTGLLYAPILGRYVGTHFLCPIGNFYQRRHKMIHDILSTQADIICLQEVGHEQDKKFFIEKLTATYPHYRYDNRKTCFLRFGNGLMIFSKFPIKKHTLYQFKERPYTEWFMRKGFTISTIIINGKAITVTHTHSTIGGRVDAATMKRTIETQQKHTYRVLQRLKGCANDIILGDLNSGPDYRSTGFNILTQQNIYQSIFKILEPHAKLPTTYSATYCNAEHKLFMDSLKLSIDHVLINKESNLTPCTARTVFEGSNISDHLGIHANFTFSQTTNNHAS